MEQYLKQIIEQFTLDTPAASCERYGHGHINVTYLVISQSGRRYILQKINNHVFKDVAGLMENIAAVTGYLSEQGADSRSVLHLVPTVDGKTYLSHEDGSFWRIYDFVEGSICLQAPETPEDFYQSAVAFGNFQQQLADFPASIHK